MLEGFLSPNILAIGVVVVFVGLLLWRDRDNIERHSILVLRRTDHGIEMLDDVASRAPSLWRLWSDVSIVAGFAVMVGIVGFLLYNGLKVLMVSEAVPAVGLVLPTTSGQASMGPGYFLIPFWHWIVGISTVAVFHELMHGVIARNEGFPVKSVGWFVLGILPGAFVEPEGEEMFPDESEDDEGGDEDEEAEEDDAAGPWGEGSSRGKLRVLAAGSGANLTIALLLFAMMTAMTTGAHGTRDVRGVYDYEGAEIVHIYNQSAAYEAGLEPGMVVQRIDGHEVRDVASFLEQGRGFEVNQTVRLAGTYNGSSFNRTVTVGTRPQTYTYSPAPIDPALVWLEKRFEGTIETYERYNDIFVDGGVRTELERWRWVRENYDGLDAKATDRIEMLSDRLEQQESGFLGVGVRSAKHVKDGMEPIRAGAEFLLTLLLFMVMIHAGVGAANMMPIKPLDGGWMLDTVVREHLPGWRRGLVRSVMGGTLVLFIVNMAVPLLF